LTAPTCRYEIEADSGAWDEAETQFLKASKGGKLNPVVSVKAKKGKRKAEASETPREENGVGEKRHRKKPKKDKKA